MSRFRHLNRRTVLKGIGASMALPLLDSMTPAAFAAPAALTEGAASAVGSSVPLRMAFCFIPNGVNVGAWKPAKTGPDFDLPPTLQPLAPVKSKLTVLSNLAHEKAKANGDGPGDHARSAGTFLTGMQVFKTAGRDIRAGISVDQVAAQKIGDRTPLPSLELGCQQGAQAGNCDSGYSCAYSSNISWRAPGTPTGKDINPRSVFTRLFGDPDQIAAKREQARRAMLRRSVLDLVNEDARDLRRKVGHADQQKLDEYLDSVREIEQRIAAAEKAGDRRAPEDAVIPEGVPGEFVDHIKLMADLMVLAFRTDTTRIATFMFANEGSNRSYPFAGVRDNHHDLSHHQNDADKLGKIARIDRFHTEQLAYFLQKLDSIKEDDDTLLDRSMIVYGCSIGDGNRHDHMNLPILLAGRGAGTIDAGRHLELPRDTPMSNLFLSMLDRLGVPEDRFGDSTGRLTQLTA